MGKQKKKAYPLVVVPRQDSSSFLGEMRDEGEVLHGGSEAPHWVAAEVFQAAMVVPELVLQAAMESDEDED
jgi:hypothetical protein